MKLLFLLIVLGAGAWFMMTRAKRSEIAERAVAAPEKYAAALQGDEARAKAVADGANKALKAGEKAVEKAVDAQ